MTEFNKKVKNPLFNNAVTGGTIEDFSQNALLLPAKEKTPPPPAPVLNLDSGKHMHNTFLIHNSSKCLTRVGVFNYSFLAHPLGAPSLGK